MRPVSTRFRSFATRMVAGLAVLQLGSASAYAVERADPDGCDEAVQCNVAFYASCAPLPAGGTSLIMPLVYLSEVHAAELVGKLPKGKLPDICLRLTSWRGGGCRLVWTGV